MLKINLITALVYRSTKGMILMMTQENFPIVRSNATFERLCESLPSEQALPACGFRIEYFPEFVHRHFEERASKSALPSPLAQH
jgi:hypothetical protein